MTEVLLKNKTRQPQVFNLDSPYWVKNRNQTPWGSPCSMSFLALEKKWCDSAVLACAEVKVALNKTGVLRTLDERTLEENPVSVPSIPDDEEFAD